MYEDYPFKTRIAFKNKTGKPLLLIIEPWAFEYMLDMDSRYVITAHSEREPTEDVVVMELDNDQLIVTSGAERPLVTLSKDGEIIGDHL